MPGIAVASAASAAGAWWRPLGAVTVADVPATLGQLVATCQRPRAYRQCTLLAGHLPADAG
jgi:hypothetical protein